MIRKSIAIFLCLCLSAALLTGCGGGSIQQYEEEDDAAEATEAPAEDEDAEATEAPAEEEDAEPTEAPAEDEDAEDTEAPAEDEDAEDTDEEAAEPTATPDPGLGYAAYDPDEVVLTYNGLEATWREYYYWLNYYVGYVQYMVSMGMPFSGWDSKDFNQTMDNAEVVRASAAESIFQYRAVELLAEQEGVALDDEDKAEMQTSFEQAADNYGDGDGTCTDEELAAYEEYMDGRFMDRELLDHLSGDSILSNKLFIALYGEDGADISDEDVLAYADEAGVMACKHILLMTIDPETNEPLSDDALAEKKAQADELYQQLAEVQDDPDALEKLFDELMNEHSEDTGLAYSPDGYQFVSGVMVPVFEETTSALEEYGLSEPVQSDYGYHIILRLPVDPDKTYTDSSGNQSSLATAAGNEKLFDLLSETTDKADIVWQGDFEDLDIAEIFGE